MSIYWKAQSSKRDSCESLQGLKETQAINTMFQEGYTPERRYKITGFLCPASRPKHFNQRKKHPNPKPLLSKRICFIWSSLICHFKANQTSVPSRCAWLKLPVKTEATSIRYRGLWNARIIKLSSKDEIKVATELTLYFWGAVCLQQKDLAKYLQTALSKDTSPASISFPSTSQND